MFIYIKEGCRSLHRKCVIDKVLLKGGFYFEISFKKRATKRAFLKAVKICDRSGKLPIVCEKTPIYMKDKRRLFNPAPFKETLLVNAFCHVAKGFDRALFIDMDGAFSEKLEKPLKSVRTLYILTNAEDRYNDACERLLSRFGVSPVIIKELNPFFVFPVIFAPAGTGSFSAKGTVIGKNGYEIWGDEVFIGGMRLPFSLASAIHLCIGTSDSENVLPCFLENGSNKYSPDGLRAKIKSSGRLP